MTIRRVWSPLAALLIAVTVLSSTAGFAAAATTPKTDTGTGAAATGAGGANGLRVSPVRSDMTINPGQSQTLMLSVTNVTASATTLQVVVNDFVASATESGQPTLILNPSQYAPSHSLKRYVQKVPNFSLQPGQQRTISITITVPANAAGGGYYGAIRFAPAGENGDSSQTVTLAGSVGSLVLVKVPGDIKEQMSIASFDVRKDDAASSFFTNRKGINAVVRFQNGGNIQEAPFGKILLKNRSGRILAEYEINNTSPRGNVLPDSIRKFPINLDKVGSFGQYKLEGNFGYGSSGQLLSASTSFYVVPVAIVILFIAGVLLLAFLIFGLPRLIRSYNRRIIRQASRKR